LNHYTLIRWLKPTAIITPLNLYTYTPIHLKP
jgi:hypothetical protein